MNFSINVVKGIKKKSNKTPLPNRISRLCLGTAIYISGVYKCKVSLRNDPDYPDYIVVPFTKESLDLKGKTIVYEQNKDEYGHYVKHYKDAELSRNFPGLPSQYTVVVEGEVCSGYVIRTEGKLYFDIKEVHGRGDYLINIPERINETIPLFNNSNAKIINEYNKD